jgi:hypothetical protein
LKISKFLRNFVLRKFLFSRKFLPKPTVHSTAGEPAAPLPQTPPYSSRKSGIMLLLPQEHLGQVLTLQQVSQEARICAIFGKN